MVEETQKIFVTLDDKNFVSNWGTSLNSDEPVYEIDLPMDSPFFSHYYSNCFQYVNGELVLSEEKLLKVELLAIASKFRRDCEETYILQKVPYTVSDTTHLFDVISDDEFINKITLLDNKIQDYVEAPAYDTTGDFKTLIKFDKSQYTAMARYIKKVVKTREHKLTNKLIPMIENAKSVEEAEKVHWDSVQDEPLPEQGTDEPQSEQSIDSLIKENKELRQKVEFNELALMDAINMFSEMNK
nr:MAG TPA: hypothetical protein [Herelleviridae sp.]